MNAIDVPLSQLDRGRLSVLKSWDYCGSMLERWTRVGTAYIKGFIREFLARRELRAFKLTIQSSMRSTTSPARVDSVSDPTLRLLAIPAQTYCAGRSPHRGGGCLDPLGASAYDATQTIHRLVESEVRRADHHVAGAPTENLDSIVAPDGPRGDYTAQMASLVITSQNWILKLN